MQKNCRKRSKSSQSRNSLRGQKFKLVINLRRRHKSIGKRILKLKIIDKNTGSEANFVKRLIRNITWLLGPTEIVVYLICKERLGDKIAGTHVIEV